MESTPSSKESHSGNVEPPHGSHESSPTTTIQVEAGFGASMQPGFKEDKLGSASKLPKPHELDEELQQESLQLQVSSPMHASDSLYDFGPAPYIEGAITPKSSTQNLKQSASETVLQESSASAENGENEPIAFTTNPSKNN
ncbi:unnamed protein product [Owenia fusiformis]|uniref:Uncharacterized protein n=1 Tax=Owenia fusiformis TaxID=6347 RepID=A0A8J1U1B9_OWEFU|nr:unnamed protein product [Owenia fusiformis]